MTDPIMTAERLLRRFARDTNLLIAGRPMRVLGEGPTPRVLTAMLRGMGARILPGSDGAPTDAGWDVSDDTVTFDVAADEILLGAEPVPDRGDASGRLEFAGAHMRVTAALARELKDRGTVAGLRVGIAMTLEPKTANLALLLAEAGAQVAVYAHPDETDPDVASALRARWIPCDADATLAAEHERDVALGFLRRGFDVLVDDGSHLTRLAHEEGLTGGWIGATEETTSGLAPLRAMAAEGALRTPVIAVNDAVTKTGFDNRYGTGQSCVLAIADLLDDAGLTVRSQPALVIGYGPVGIGVAAHLRALGAAVSVAEVDPVRAMLAEHDGFEVGDALTLAAGALVVSCTGVPRTVTQEMLEVAAIVAVAGGVPGEVDLSAMTLEPLVVEGRPVPALDVARPTTATILDRGGCINVTAAEGNPIEIMDLSFATQLAAIAELVLTRPGIGVHAVSDAAVAHVGAVAAQARGIVLSTPATADADDAADWRSPRYRRHEAGS
ncbi:adenosylhomocysteinase [Demequina capsici]|uniref:Adenosylhomocysteinase n=1 Tax=Demequina capsici TaxID=3075620 RepID=A0AA96FD52_9MICO|nr:adenosylhomocysteinase [Demequina sp. PMTSA13]WNM27948.1 adenosylhomocysteinase [Demequina sp. PMTSA13]